MTERIRIRSAWPLLAVPLLAGIAGGVVGLWASSRQPQIYRVTTTLVAAPSTRLSDGGDLLRALDTLERRSVLATLARIPETADVRDSIARQLGVDVESLRAYKLRGTVLPHVHVVQIEVLGPDPSLARVIAEAAARSTRRRARELYSVYSLRQLDPAKAPRRPVRPDIARDTTIAGLLGIFLGAVFVATWRVWARGPAGDP